MAPTAGGAPGRAETRRAHPPDAEILCVAARATPCEPCRRLAARAGAELEPGPWGQSPGGGGAGGAGHAVARLLAGRRSGCGGTHRDGQALAEGVGWSRGRAAPLQPAPPVQLSYAPHRAQPGQNLVGADRRCGGADGGRWDQATACGPGLHAPVRCRPGRGYGAPARPCTAASGGLDGPGTGHVRGGGHGGRGRDAAGTQQSQSGTGPGLGSTQGAGPHALGLGLDEVAGGNAGGSSNTP